VFCGHKNFFIGKQPEPFPDTSTVSYWRVITGNAVALHCCNCNTLKLLEHIVAAQLTDYLKSADLLPRLQSGFRPHHSTEMATLRVLSDLLTAIDGGDVTALVLLDLSAAFDTILCRRL